LIPAAGVQPGCRSKIKQQMKNTNQSNLKPITLAISGFLALSGNPLSARIQEEAIHELDDFVVTANRYAVPRSEVGSVVNVIQREDLELGTSPYVLDSLRELPGVSLRNNGGPGAVFGMTTRGLNQNRPIVLLDGIEVSNPADGTMLNPGFLFADSVERIEFLKGAQSSLYGASALGGVIQITSRELVEDGTAGDLNLGYGSWNTRLASLHSAVKEGNLSASFTVSHVNSDGYSSQDTDNEDDGYKNTSFKGKVSYQVADSTNVYLLAHYIDTQSEYDATFAPYSFDPSGLTESQQFFAAAGGDVEVSETWLTKVNFGYTKVRNKSTDDSYGAYATKGNRFKADWRNIITLSDTWTVIAGIEHEDEENETNSVEWDETSLFVDNSAELVPGLHWTLGARYDDNSTYGDHDTWRTTFSYQLADAAARLHGSYGTSFQAPTFLQTLDPVYGNPDLGAETGEGWDLGIEVALIENRVIWDVTLYGYDIDNKINFSWATSTYQNEEAYKSQGVESSIVWNTSSGLKLKANYTFAEAEYGDKSTAERVPKHTANLIALWKTMGDKLTLRGSVNYVGKRLDLRSDSGQLPDYATLNAGVRYTLSDSLTASLNLNNLLDKDYQEIRGYNSAGFNLQVGLRYTF
jgi:vitamin B12 transporter